MAHKIPEHVLGNPFSKWELTVKEQPFSLLEFYKRVHRFLQEEGWRDLKGSSVDGGGGEYEDYFFQRDENGMQFNQIWWRATKRPNFHGNKYIQFYLGLDMATIAMKTKEVVVNGQKVKLQDGELRIRAFLYLVQGDENPGSSGKEWQENTFLSMAKSLGFWKKTTPETVKRSEMELMKFSNDLYELCQTYTGIRREGVQKDFFPAGGALN